MLIHVCKQALLLKSRISVVLDMPQCFEGGAGGVVTSDEVTTAKPLGFKLRVSYDIEEIMSAK